ncbi:hypothetical protein GGP41_003797 [Bipolaris sorokiniana]|uniref:Terpene synthase n=1 Tax=Cochliobolus sativus TaxID=45130 RepID=A0A8H5ZBS3_COCSA|nr:hypothetical protein GGP41_003797 [Bipolaris sorokiniana]
MEERTIVIIPNLYKCFLTQEPRSNQGYQVAKLESERWLAKTCDFAPSMSKKVNACDFSYFISIAAPDAPPDRLKTLCDWGNWLSVGVAPLYHLVEYAHEIVLPDEVFEHPVIQALERLGADFVILSNDILSYRKEEVSPGLKIHV